MDALIFGKEVITEDFYELTAEIKRVVLEYEKIRKTVSNENVINLFSKVIGIGQEYQALKEGKSVVLNPIVKLDEIQLEVVEQMLHLVVEIYELYDAIINKKSKKAINDEAADILNVFIYLLETIGISTQNLIHTSKNKLKILEQRIGVSKMNSKNEVLDEIKRSQDRIKNAKMDIGADVKIEEVAIRKMSVLSDVAKEEVMRKLNVMNTPFNFEGYAKISYGGSPLRIVSVDPIEGTAIDYVNSVLEKVQK